MNLKPEDIILCYKNIKSIEVACARLIIHTTFKNWLLHWRSKKLTLHKEHNRTDIRYRNRDRPVHFQFPFHFAFIAGIFRRQELSRLVEAIK